MTVAIENVTIRYGRHVAVQDVTAQFPAGAVGLLGRNGAGKTSILKALLGLVRPAAGSMRILDLPQDTPPDLLRARLGYMPERDGHLPGLNGYEMVVLLGCLSGLGHADAARRAHEVLYLVGLEEQRYRPVSGYSAGMRQKVKLAAALVHDPAVMFLDEPTNGLDPSGREEMLRLIRHLSRDLGKSVVLSTHILQDVENVCDSVVLLEQGRVVAHGSLKDLTRTDTREYQIEVDPPDLQLDGRGSPAVQFSPLRRGRYLARMEVDVPTAELFRSVKDAGGQVCELVLQRRTLEDVFMTAVGMRPKGGSA